MQVAVAVRLQQVLGVLAAPVVAVLVGYLIIQQTPDFLGNPALQILAEAEAEAVRVHTTLVAVLPVVQV